MLMFELLCASSRFSIVFTFSLTVLRVKVVFGLLDVLSDLRGNAEA